MAEFNPDIGSAPAPDFTGVSRGTGPNRAFEALFSGVGNALEQGVRTADTYIQNKIEDEARYGFETQNQKLGLDPDVVPSEITQTSEGLSTLALAHQQGKVTPEYYYNRLAATMKSLRAKYPGYEKEVDDIIQKVTGTRPANAFRDLLFQNLAQAQQAAASSQTKTQTFVQNNAKYLNEDEILNPEKYGGLEGLAVTINLRKSREYQWEAEEKQIDRDQKLALPTLNQRFNFTAADALSQLSKAVGFGDQSFDVGLRNLGSKGFTPEQQAAAVAGIDAVIAQTEAKMLQDQTRPAFSTLPPTTLRDMRMAALQPLRDIRDKIAGKDYSGAAILAASLQLSQDQAKAQLYKTDPRFTTLDALKNIAPDVVNTMTNEIIQESGSSRTFFDRVSTYNLVGGVIQGADTSNAIIDRLENNPKLTQTQKNSEAGAYVDGLTRTLGKADIPSEQLSQIILKNYAEDSGADRLWSAVTSDQKLTLYSKLFSPEITKKVFENGSDEAKAAYQNAAVNRFQNIPEFREAAANLSEQLPYAQFAKASYDPRTNRLRIDVDRSAMANLGYFQRDNQQAEIQRLGKFADKFNQALTIMAPIIEAAGGDETEGIKRLLSDMNVELNGGKKTGVYYWLSTVVDELMKPTPTEGVDVEQSRQNMREGLESISGLTNYIPDVTIGGDMPEQVVVNSDRDSRGIAQEGSRLYNEITSREVAPPEDQELQFIFKEPDPQAISTGIPTQEMIRGASGQFTGDFSRFQGETTPIGVASKFVGVNEKQHKDIISRFIRNTAGININPAETAWCAAFVNGVLGATGQTGTGRLNARSFLKWGRPTDTPREGDIVVLTRGNPNSWTGHVGFYAGRGKNGRIKILGGNQNNSVSIKEFPESQVLGYRTAE